MEDVKSQLHVDTVDWLVFVDELKNWLPLTQSAVFFSWVILLDDFILFYLFIFYTFSLIF